MQKVNDVIIQNLANYLKIPPITSSSHLIASELPNETHSTFSLHLQTLPLDLLCLIDFH